MQKISLRLVAVLSVVGALSACAQGTTPTLTADGQRALIGAGAGAVAAKAFDGSVGKGALAGAALGALCDDVSLCPQY
ncbi:MAG: hypothetical protein DI498_11570 [Paracoccus denitrificans]|nr:MAG: hypothetical protein DI498_11570 [Paracoccus denitrificans]PZO83497.1 MAG: hypothetical protein DI633_11570 [Paracoccus denitrificans]